MINFGFQIILYIEIIERMVPSVVLQYALKMELGIELLLFLFQGYVIDDIL